MAEKPGYMRREEEQIAADFVLVRAAINKPWNSPGEVSTILANAALDRLAYKFGAGAGPKEYD